MSNDIHAFDPDALPAVVARYLESQADSAQRRSIVTLFASDARVVDEGIEHIGTAAIGEWLATAASEFTYTTTFTGQSDAGEDRWVVHARLEGDFPGGVADLRYQFAIAGDQIVDLVIAP